MKRYWEILRQRWYFTKRLYYCARYNMVLESPQVKYITKEKIGYLLNYKVASSSIYSSLITKETGQVFKGNLHSHAQQHLKDSVDNKDEYFIFTFVRNPLERLVSCYQNKFVDFPNRQNNTTQYINDIYFWGWLGRTSSFENFVRKIDKIPNHLLEGHFTLQSNFIFDKEGNSRANFIGKYENITEDYAKIQEKYQLPDLPKANKSQKGDWREFYTIETAKIIIKKYQKDIDNFGYQKEAEDLLNFLENKKNYKQ